MTTVETSDFFRKRREPEEIKSEILGKYFPVWCGITLEHYKAATADLVLYVDLQAAPHSDTTAIVSAPALVLREIQKSTGARLDLTKSVQTFFSDPDVEALAKQKESLAQLAFYQKLQQQPVFLQEEADHQLLQSLLGNGHAALFYLNPFKNACAQQVLSDAITSKDSDLLMLFTFNEIQAAVKSTKSDNWLQQLLGDRLAEIRAFYKNHKAANSREKELLHQFESTFSEKGFQTLTFRINDPDQKQASYYLVFATRMEQAYTRLKEMLLTYSDFQEDGVPLFGANLQQQQTALFHEHYTYSITNLVHELTQQASAYSNRTVQYVYERHSIGTHYTLANYKVAFEKLMRQGIVRFINPKTGQPVSKSTATSLIRYTLPKK